MKRPSEITQDLILKTAVRLFAERGYEATSIRTLAAKHHEAVPYFHRPSTKSLLSFKTGRYSMARKPTKRRAWTAEHVRTLRTMAQKENCIAHRQKAEVYKGRNAAKGI
jgi:hypothetical protein